MKQQGSTYVVQLPVWPLPPPSLLLPALMPALLLLQLLPLLLILPLLHPMLSPTLRPLALTPQDLLEAKAAGIVSNGARPPSRGGAGITAAVLQHFNPSYTNKSMAPSAEDCMVNDLAAAGDAKKSSSLSRAPKQDPTDATFSAASTACSIGLLLHLFAAASACCCCFARTFC
jgi:hypothetical protein